MSEEKKALLPSDATARKAIPVGSGVLDYFPAAIAEVAKVSLVGNIQHNGPNAPLFWARGKSMDQSDTIIRHWLERGTTDTDGVKHSAKMAWRALALLQLELEAEGAPIARGARLPDPEPICLTSIFPGTSITGPGSVSVSVTTKPEVNS